MLKRAYRLRHRQEIVAIRQAGQQKRHPLAVLLYQRRAKENENSRFAFVASRRIGKAVVRNRSKRVMRAVIQAHWTHITPGWDCIFLARGRIVKATYIDIEAGLVQLLSRAGIWHENIDVMD
ncbi:MAG TPA: ribonuclease P protein component [Anaerolineae bacterium]|nr:ribonuclease P protein component [Anaerolineae bacterium]